MDGDRRIYRVSIIGDLFTGKSTLIETLKTKRFYDLKFAVTEKHWLELKGKRLEISEVVPCFGESIETVKFDKSESFILCYSVDVRSSYTNIEYWNSRIEQLQPSVAKILVATKTDTRPERPNPTRFVSKEEGFEMMKKIKADHFVECSSKAFQNVDLVFEMAVEAVLVKDKIERKKKTKDCVTM